MLTSKKMSWYCMFFQIPGEIKKQRNLRHALTTHPSAVKFEEQYVAFFPGIEEHKNHVVGEVWKNFILTVPKL